MRKRTISPAMHPDLDDPRPHPFTPHPIYRKRWWKEALASLGLSGGGQRTFSPGMLPGPNDPRERPFVPHPIYRQAARQRWWKEALAIIGGILVYAILGVVMLFAEIAKDAPRYARGPTSIARRARRRRGGFL